MTIPFPFRLGWIILLSCLAGYFALGIYCVTTDPAACMAGLPMHQGLWPSAPSASCSPEARTISGFRLTDTAGREVALADFKAKKAIAVVCIGVECPLVNKYVPRLAELQHEFEGRGV
ncbi:MAG: redoxin domain-containing protein, partial [Planctomycetes bacterium]|nr:redoxin domain-containing protein [Planctomycetota bacterium]